MNSFAKLISGVSNPVLLSIPMSYAIVFKSREDALYALSWTLLSMLFAGIVGLFVFWGVQRGLFSDFDISKREERTPIFIFTALLSTVYFAIILLLNGPRMLLVALGVLFLGILIADLINRKIKASIHLAVFSSFSLVLGILYGGIFWALLLLIPVVAWSRIKLKRHLFSEIIIGTLIGLSLVLIIYLVVKYFVL